MLQSPTFWTAIGFVILIAGIAKPVWKSITTALDNRANKIKTTLDEATQLREEAQHLLAEYQRNQRDAAKQCEDLITRAKTDGEVQMDEARATMAAALKRREEQAIEKIAQAEAEALQQIRNTTVDISIAAAQRIIEKRMDGGTSAALIDSTIAELPAKLN